MPKSVMPPIDFFGDFKTSKQKEADTRRVGSAFWNGLMQGMDDARADREALEKESQTAETAMPASRQSGGKTAKSRRGKRGADIDAPAEPHESDKEYE